uniref:Cyclin-H n=1 Tax=Aceria tosichella TaxID=561515 RepID=A0A6G1S3C7_9ACAR
MFNTSTQRKHWIYPSVDELDRLRANANAKFANSGKIPQDLLLTPKDESYLIRKNLVRLREFCKKFQPVMRNSVIATAFIYMKRFYLNQSCMEYNPRDICVTCAYLACKVDEFNVSIDQFIKNVQGDCRKAQKTVLSNEMLLMKKMQFHLTVHLPFRAVEGFYIDIRARYPPARDKTSQIAEGVEDYLEKSMYTDACFLYSPSQIALAAVVYGAEKQGIDLSSYLSDILFVDDPEALDYFQVAANEMKSLIDKDLQNSPGKETIKRIEKKLQEIMTPQQNE